MVEVVWTPRAVRNLREIHRFISRDSQWSAEATVERVQSAVWRLEPFPLSGRGVPEFGTPYREILVNPYRVIYRYDQEHDAVIVLNVVHGSRRLPPSLEEP